MNRKEYEDLVMAALAKAKDKADGGSKLYAEILLVTSISLALMAVTNAIYGVIAAIQEGKVIHD